ncbi:magnesium transporter MgtE [Holospora obtusa F1]|uniref:Magnesium transporter MgtE n=1 Tax=Holospora obtusa F1 TaxID=1399147 RepID=W6TGQ7_HOLOB|nr:magnesium transporter [Holospora obtusa]ETZ07105.1 magnesium transporter MgtE [Holospora obtusa F1]
MSITPKGLYLTEGRLVQALSNKIASLRILLDHSNNSDELNQLMKGLYPSEIAYLIQHLEEEQRRKCVLGLKSEFNAEILLFLSPSLRKEVVNLFDISELSQILINLESDDVLNILRDLEAIHYQKALNYFPVEKSRFFLERLRHPQHTACALMRSEVLVFPDYWKVCQALEHIRSCHTPRFYDVFVVDHERRFLGSIELSAFVKCQEDELLSEVMTRSTHVIPIDWGQDEITFMFRLYELISAPVVDKDSRIVGVITVDDVMRVIEDKVAEDFMHLGGIHASDFYETVSKTSVGRLNWLLITVIDAILTSLVIQYFERVLHFKQGLIILMPIAAAMGGNSGIQAATVAIRALATRELNALNSARFLWKEVSVSCFNGALLGGGLGVLAFLWFKDIRVGLVLGGAVLFNMLWAGIAGTLFPMIIARLSGDPALSSGPLLTTTTDVFGYGLFLGLSYFIFKF